MTPTIKSIQELEQAVKDIFKLGKCKCEDGGTCFRCWAENRILKAIASLRESQPKIRPEIMEFAQEMERIMSKHDAKKGDSWKTCDVGFLRDKLYSEYKEANTLHSEPSELVDLANIAMMLWYRKDKLLQQFGGKT